MSRRAAVLVALVALVVGLGGGYYYALWSYGKLQLQMVAGRNAAQISLDTKLLRRLRANDSEGTLRTMEPLLYSDVVALRQLLDHVPKSEWEQSYPQTLQAVAAYRAEFPPIDEPSELRVQVEAALAPVSER